MKGESFNPWIHACSTLIDIDGIVPSLCAGFREIRKVGAVLRSAYY